MAPREGISKEVELTAIADWGLSEPWQLSEPWELLALTAASRELCKIIEFKNFLLYMFFQKWITFKVFINKDYGVTLIKWLFHQINQLEFTICHINLIMFGVIVDKLLNCRALIT